MKDITAIVVTHNTKQLFEIAFNSFRNFHPEMQMIIVDGSDPDDPCQRYVAALASEITTAKICNYNIGHGRGMHLAISMCKTRFALIFDSDIEMIESPVERMLEMMEEDTYAVGYLEKTGFDGYEYGAHAIHQGQGFMMMMHPYFHLLQVPQYFKFQPYVHHGAPCFKAALDIHQQGLSKKILKEFPGLGHTGGQGWNWTAIKGRYILHNTAGTRKDRVRRGKSEIEQGWEL